MPDANDRPEPDVVPEQGDLAHADEVLDGEIASDEAQEKGRRLIATKEFYGPLPAPEVLGEYDTVKPGLADIIVEQWQKETAHRHKTIDSVRKTDHESMQAYYSGERRGQWIGLAAFLAIVAVAVLAILEGSDVAAIGSLIVAGSYAIWALRRNSAAPAPPTDLGDGDEIEAMPDKDASSD